MATQPRQMIIVGSYATADQPGIQAFGFDSATGSLTAQGGYEGIYHPSFLVIHPNRQWLYAVSETGEHDVTPGAVWALRMEGLDGATPFRCTALNAQPSGGNWPCHVTLDRSGRRVLVSNYGHGHDSLSVLPIMADGSLGPRSATIKHHGSGPHPHRQESSHAHSAILSPDNRFAIVADLGIDRLAIYRFDEHNGTLASHGWALARPGAGPRHMVFHPNGRLLYVANELDCTVSVYSYDPAGGLMEEQQAVDSLPPGAPENTVADIHLAHDQRRLYVSNRGHNSIAVFDLDSEGLLHVVGYPSCGGDWPRNFALAPGGSHLLVANQQSDEVTVLPLNAGPEPIGAPVARVAVAGASCIQFVSTE